MLFCVFYVDIPVISEIIQQLRFSRTKNKTGDRRKSIFCYCNPCIEWAGPPSFAFDRFF